MERNKEEFKMTDAKITLWGTDIGVVTWMPERDLGVFQYYPEFLQSGIQLSPLQMPLRETSYEFVELRKTSFKGLPGLIADSLPDKFGNQMINVWLATQGRSKDSLYPVEELCYLGSRGMGGIGI